MAWDLATACLFTGDETGRLRCWCLRKILEALGAEPTGEMVAGEGRDGSAQNGGRKGESGEGWGARLGERAESGGLLRRHVSMIILGRVFRWLGRVGENL